jgi:hypothetical protein
LSPDASLYEDGDGNLVGGQAGEKLEGEPQILGKRKARAG